MKTKARPEKWQPLDDGKRIEVGGYTLTLGSPSPNERGGVEREGRSGDGHVCRLLEFPKDEIPESIRAAFDVPRVAKPVGRFEDDERTILALRPAPGPTLDWLMRRSEGLPLWGLDLVDSLAELFQAVHDGKLSFRAATPRMFSVAPGGEIHLEEPDALRRSGEPASRVATLYAAPEVVGGAEGGAWSDQYALGVIAYGLLSGRAPHARGELPLLRIFRAQTPHGLVSALARATREAESERYDSCRSLATALRERTAPCGASPRTVAMGAATEIGRIKCQQTPVNQDAWFVGHDPATRRAILLVADGVSTADVGSGDLASSCVREAVKAAWEGPVGDILRGSKTAVPDEWAKAALEAILEDANARIYAFLKQPIFVGSLGPGTHPPSSTAVLSILDGDRLTVANVGDSRLYLLRGGALEQMTVDQDLRTDFLKAGRDPRAIGDQATLGALTQSVGSFFFDNEGNVISRQVKADVQTLWLRAGDRIVVCSDGVPDCLGEAAEAVMTRELGTGDDAEAIAKRLCRLADEALGADNITALVLLAS